LCVTRVTALTLASKYCRHVNDHTELGTDPVRVFPCTVKFIPTKQSEQSEQAEQAEQ
jgi:hypothetical protein